ncbi:hypothetical protein [Methylobacterium oryzihabitans]|uniref:Phosphohydrolase n=1 Tax=Methylobacterium oryzihabitans TaxID=2499852 RepID=A0A3S2V6T1_9HYPH|nr:hypothetical protein [Methylobacterium oryzihabitans]RVU15209.1 hypothetical protein EOE48_20595 [Methylobacterium oryzihabitans]
MTAQPWIPSVNGLPIDLVTPCAAQVDFAEIAWALSQIHRYAGNARSPVSVGLHTLIGLDLCPLSLRPLWLLHDAHEARLGDWTTPAVDALGAVATEMFGEAFAAQMASVRRALAERHDAVIHRAAGLPLPGIALREAIHTVDLRALATERRDFLRAMPAAVRRPWAIDALGIGPGPKVWRPLPATEVEMRLMACFNTHLPALMPGRAA